MKNFFASFKLLMMSVIVALILFPVTPFNESTAEASEVFAYSEGNVDYYVDTDITVWINLPGIGYGANMKARGSSYPPILTIRYVFMDTNSREEGWLDNQGWGYEVVFRYMTSIGGNPFFNHIGHLSESWKAQKVFNIIYPKILEKRRERREEQQRIAEEKRREEQRIAVEKQRKEDEFNSLVAQGDKFYADKNYTAAIQSYAKAENLDFGSIYTFRKELIKNGDKLSSQGNYSAALDYYKKAATTYYQSGSPFHESLLYKIVDQGSGTVVTVTIPTFYESLLYKIIDLFGKSGNIVDEENFCNALTKSSPNEVSLQVFLGSFYIKSGEFYKALAPLTKASELAPEDPKILSLLGATCLMTKKYDEAIKNFNNTLKISPKDFNAHYYLGIVYEQKKDYKTAKKYLKQALKISPNNSDVKEALNRISKAK